MKTKGRAANTKTIEEIKWLLEEHKEEVSQKYKVREIGIFGSFVRGEQKKRSDIDILVEFDNRNIPGLIKFIEIERYLEKLLLKKVDLVRKGGIKLTYSDWLRNRNTVEFLGIWEKVYNPNFNYGEFAIIKS